MPVKDGLWQADIEPVSQRERKTSQRRARGMVSVGINKMEAHVRGLYWGILKRHIDISTTKKKGN